MRCGELALARLRLGDGGLCSAFLGCCWTNEGHGAERKTTATATPKGTTLRKESSWIADTDGAGWPRPQSPLAGA